MLVKIGLGIAVVLLVLVVIIATRPDTFRVLRSTAIGAPAETVFSRINDFHQWASWSPWENLDPAMKKTFEGPPTGKGSIYAWASENKKVGKGKMTILESQPNQRIAINLQFLEPFPATSLTEFSIEPRGSGVTLTWAMTGHNNFPAKAFSLFMNMDQLIGKDFEKGLAGLKLGAESASRSP